MSRLTSDALCEVSDKPNIRPEPLLSLTDSTGNAQITQAVAPDEGLTLRFDAHAWSMPFCGLLCCRLLVISCTHVLFAG